MNASPSSRQRNLFVAARSRAPADASSCWMFMTGGCEMDRRRAAAKAQFFASTTEAAKVSEFHEYTFNIVESV
jgi:hypothetical protein